MGKNGPKFILNQILQFVHQSKALVEFSRYDYRLFKFQIVLNAIEEILVLNAMRKLFIYIVNIRVTSRIYRTFYMVFPD